MKKVLLITVLLSAQGCSAYKHQIHDYTHPSVARDQRDKDEEECSSKGYEARSNAGGWFVDGFLGTSTSFNKGFSECAQAKGYKLK
jgi:hypothetical protein